MNWLTEAVRKKARGGDTETSLRRTRINSERVFWFGVYPKEARTKKAVTQRRIAASINNEERRRTWNFQELNIGG